jgi:hypothetical protein
MEMLCIANIPQTTHDVQHNTCVVNFFWQKLKYHKEEASKEVGLAVNTGETKHMLMSHHHIARQSNNIDSNRPFEKVGKFLVFGNGTDKITIMKTMRIN